MKYPVTPDGRYMVVRGRLWRVADGSAMQDTYDLWMARNTVSQDGTRPLDVYPPKDGLQQAVEAERQ